MCIPFVNQGQPVHQLWPPEDVVCSTNFDVVLFHGLQRQGERDAWKSTWVQRNNPHNCWAQSWLPQDLGENVRVLAPSYDSCIVQCGNQGNTDDVSEIARNILQILVIRFVLPDVHTGRHRQVTLNHLNERGIDTNKLALDHKEICFRICCKGEGHFAGIATTCRGDGKYGLTCKTKNLASNLEVGFVDILWVNFKN